MPPEIVLFVFRRRGTRTISVRRTCLDAGNLVGSLRGMPRRRKTKRRGTICVLPYKQATPAGFALEATNSQPRHGGALRDVGNDKAFPGRSNVRTVKGHGSVRNRQLLSGCCGLERPRPGSYGPLARWQYPDARKKRPLGNWPPESPQPNYEQEGGPWFSQPPHPPAPPIPCLSPKISRSGPGPRTWTRLPQTQIRNLP